MIYSSYRQRVTDSANDQQLVRKRAKGAAYDGAMRLAVWAVLGIGALGCSGTIETATTSDPSAAEPGPTAGRNSGGGGSGGGATSGLIDDGPANATGPLACTQGSPVATTRLVRLTHRQYDNAIRDLTGLDLHPAQEFLADPHQAGFDRGLDLQVGAVLEKAYRDAAEDIAAQVVNSPAAYAKVVGCQPSAGKTCAQSYIAAFGRRVLRRPLTDVEKASYLTLFDQGAALLETGDDFQRGVQITLEALLQSPKFLYRVELSDTKSQGLVALSSYEVASRLSFLLVNTTPDDALLSAAADGALSSPEEVAAQAERLLATKDAKETVRDFHHQWLDMDIYANKLTKDATRFPSVTPDLAPTLQQETERFVDSVTFDKKRGYASLMTAPFTFANATTAKLYGVAGTFGADLKEVQLDQTQRAGLLTQVGFLATHAFSNLSSPIHRGVFVQRKILCATIRQSPAERTEPAATRWQQHQDDAPASRHAHGTAAVRELPSHDDQPGRLRLRELRRGRPVSHAGERRERRRLGPRWPGRKTMRPSATPSSCRRRSPIRLKAASVTPRTGFATRSVAQRRGGRQLRAVGDRGPTGGRHYTALDLLVDMSRTNAFLYRTPG